MCGIIGIWSPKTTENLEILLLGLNYLHRRGPEGRGAGFVNPFNGQINHTKASSKDENFSKLVSKMGQDVRARISVGQTRYITDKRTEDLELKFANTQPIHLWYDGLHGLTQEIIGVHNGQIEKKEELKMKIKFPAPSIANVDTRYLIELIMQEIRIIPDKWEAIKSVMKDLVVLDGAASVIFSDGKDLAAWRDPQGYRPLIYGQIMDSHVFVSESAFFNEASTFFGTSNTKIHSLIQPGEMYLVDQNGNLTQRMLVKAERRDCCFEDIYIKDEQSLDNMGTGSARRCREKIGQELARLYQQAIKQLDVITPAPKSGTSYGHGIAQESGIPYRDLLRKPILKNQERYFLSVKTERMHSFVVDASEVKGRDVGVAEDSIIRGDTIVDIYTTLKDAGAKSVKVFCGWPPTLFDCYYGADFKSGELLAYHLKEEGVIRVEDERVDYDINSVNLGVTQLLRKKITAVHGEKYQNASDLEVYYATPEIIQKNQATPTACKRCILKR